MSYETRFRWISFQFRARRSKNYEAYERVLLNNFCKAVAEIEKKDADLEFRNSKKGKVYKRKPPPAELPEGGGLCMAQGRTKIPLYIICGRFFCQCPHIVTPHTCREMALFLLFYCVSP
ncbi:MAG: hypothetical protein Q8P52_03195 [bacterium]|nr:hypothetical protein [bacterium]